MIQTPQKKNQIISTYCSQTCGSHLKKKKKVKKIIKSFTATRTLKLLYSYLLACKNNKG